MKYRAKMLFKAFMLLFWVLAVVIGLISIVISHVDTLSPEIQRSISNCIALLILSGCLCGAVHLILCALAKRSS